MRSLGSQLKVSIHRDRRCNVGFSKEFESTAKELFGAQSRHWERWTLPDARVVRAVQVIIPDSELAPFASKEADPMAWIPSPGEGKSVVFSVFIAEPPGEFVWESPEKSGNLLGIMASKTRFTWLVHGSQVLDEATIKMIEDGRTKAAQRAAPHLADAGLEGLRMVLWGGDKGTNVFFVELDASRLTPRGTENAAKRPSEANT